MGNEHSCKHTNLGKTCTSLIASPTFIQALWGDSLKVWMGIQKKDDHSDVWYAIYKTVKQGHPCCLELQARQDDSGVESMKFDICDRNHADKIDLILVEMTRVGRDGLRGGITDITSSGRCWSYTSAKQDFSVETTIVSYNDSYRDGLFVLQKKKMNYSENAYMVTMAHYYVTKAFGLCVSAEICHHKDKGFVVEFMGPFKHPSADLRRVIEETHRTGVWPTGANSNAKTGDSNPSWKSNNTVAQNHGNEDSFNNLGNGNQNFSHAKIYQRHSWYSIFNFSR